MANINEYYELRESTSGHTTKHQYPTYTDAYDALTSRDKYNVSTRFFKFDTICKITVKEMPVECPYKKVLDDILNTSIDEISMSNRLHNVLYNADIRIIKNIYDKTVEETEAIKGLGKLLFEELLKILVEKFNIVADYIGDDTYVWQYSVKQATDWKIRAKKREEIKKQRELNNKILKIDEDEE